MRRRASSWDSPLALHGGDDQIGDADPSRAGAEEQNPLFGQRRVDDLQRRRQPGEHDAGRALDVVVVAEHLVDIAVEHTDCIRPLPVLEVDAAAGEDLLHRQDEFFDELVQLLVGRRLLTQAEIERVGPERRVGRADVEEHRQQAIGRHRGARRVELQLADRDAHAVGADVAEAEDAPAGRDADEAHVPLGPVAQHLGDAALHLARDVHAARAPVDVAEGKAGIGNSRIIEDRYEARRVGHDRAVKQCLVPVRQTDQIDVALEIRRLRVEVLHHALDLPVKIFHRMRQKAFQPVSAALFGSECRTPVANGVVQQRTAPQGFRRLSLGGRDHVIPPLFQWGGSAAARAIGKTESERTPCAPWMRTPSMSAVADGPVWKQA